MCSIKMFIELKKYFYTIKYFRTPIIDKNNYQYIFFLHLTDNYRRRIGSRNKRQEKTMNIE